MKRQGLLALALSMILVLSACGASSSNSPSSNDTNNDKPNATTPDSSIPTKNIPTSGDSVTDDFLKTITAETAEAKGVCGADLTWYFQDGVLVIKGTGEMTDYTSDNKSPWHELEIGWVIIQEGVTSIGNKAFKDCYILSKIEMPETLEKIGNEAFWRCPELVSITLPASLSYIGGNAFIHDEKLLSITFIGNAPELEPNTQIFMSPTIYYSGSGFDELIEKYPNINWVKQ